jgi:4-alpha-glucanotransferase
VPMQDVLGLGSDARMNVPSLEKGNWRWRFNGDLLHPELARKLAALAEVSDRVSRSVPAIVGASGGQEWVA